jgi:transcriptional regulator with GAF, ATPase, and Fis domain
VLGTSAPIRALVDRLETVAATDSTVLLLGETGTGKELAARHVHERSSRRSMPLVKVNCAAIPEGLLESEMFGHVRGAFTGATQPRRGKFALADRGTLFMDEVSALSVPLQQKLLRVLQEKEFEPLGSERTQRVDVRLIAASNRDLAALTRSGLLLDDLYYRLNVIPLRMPSLRERREDIPLLASHFLARFRGKLGKAVDGFAEDALNRLLTHHWPGNVRELENAVERAVALAAGPLIRAEDVSELAPPTEQDSSLDLHDHLSRATREAVVRSLHQVKGRKKDAAALLGISQRALSYYLKKLDI